MSSGKHFNYNPIAILGIIMYMQKDHNTTWKTCLLLL